MASSNRPDRASRPSLRRPNGRPQACEPCRKRKVACDNVQPVCKRCQKASRRTQCEYILDPRMSILSPSSPIRAPAPPSPAHSAGRAQGAVERLEESDTGITPVSSSLPHTPLVSGPGYLGPTSFYGIYEEAESRLPYRGDGGGRNASCGMTAVSAEQPPVMSPATLEMCLDILKHFPLREDADKMSLVNPFPNEIWFLVGSKALASFYDSFGRYLEKDRTDASLAELAKILCSNTARPFSEDETEPDIWIGQFAGLKSRWEMLGIMFTYWAVSAAKRKPFGADLVRDHQNGSEMPKYLKLIDLCLDVCRSLTNGNSLLVFILLRRAVIESWKSGDASPAVWRYHGETAALFTYLGLHAETGIPSAEPTICSEWKRRLCGYVFNIDKVIASFTGRPPALGRRYVLTPMPLDLSDQDLLLDRATLSRKAQSLDSEGWNQEGRLYPATVVRARWQIALFRDELFEIALGHGRETTVENLLDVLQREKAMMERLPVSSVYKESDFLDPTMDQNMLFSRLLVHLEHLQNHFFIHRLLIQRGYDSQTNLVAVSFEMVSLTLLFWTHLDHIPRIVKDLEWLVMAYAAPGGGILCQELLRRTAGSGVVDTADIPNTAPSSTATSPTRFAILEKLFLLVGFLDWVSPEAPNSDLCRSCKNVIRHVLELTTQEKPTVAEGTQSTAAFEPWNWDLGDTALGFEFGLLDTFDWLRPDLGSSQGISEATQPV